MLRARLVSITTNFIKRYASRKRETNKKIKVRRTSVGTFLTHSCDLSEKFRILNSSDICACTLRKYSKAGSRGD